MSVMLPCSLSLMIKIKDHLNSHLGMVYYINPGHISNHGFNPSHISILAIAIAGVFLTVFFFVVVISWNVGKANLIAIFPIIGRVT